MNKILAASLLLSALVAPTAAPAQEVRFGVTIGNDRDRDYRYNGYGYQSPYYHGPVWLDRRGNYRCNIWGDYRHGRVGYLYDRYWRPVTRYTFNYGTNRSRLRCL